MAVLAGTRVVVPEAREVIEDGWVQVVESRIGAVGRGRPPASAGSVEHLGGWLLPGFIDLHVHGGGGHDVTRSPAAIQGSAAFHRRHGTTATLVSLVTAPVDSLCRQLGWVADVAETPGSRVLGAHLEGPFLAPQRAGAQDPAHMLAPDRAVLRRLVDAGRGRLRSVTLAPELPGALELIDELVSARIVVGIGHTDATYAQAAAAFARGARAATHLYNAMRPVHHREPGPVLAALDAGAYCEVINDGIHVHAAVLREVQARGPGRLVLVTDAIGAAGTGDGLHRLGDLEFEVRDGVARLVSGGALAGSTLTMNAAVRRAVSDGLSLPAAVAAAATTPAALIGDAERGRIAVGCRADLVLLNEQLELRGVMVAGNWVDGVVGVDG